MIANWLTGLALLGYLALLGWTALRLRRAHEQAVKRFWQLVTLAAVASTLWTALQLLQLSAEQARLADRSDLAGWGGWLRWVAGADWSSAAAWLDWLRHVAWLGLLFHMLGLAGVTEGRWQLLRALVPLALAGAALVLLATQARWVSRDLVALLPLHVGLMVSVIGLVLLEQLYRNAGEDQRWNIKPLCLGLSAGFGFDLYLYAEALLLRQPNVGMFELRPIVHALGVPLLILGAARSHGQPLRMALSRDAVFHSAALLLAGGYLMLVAALGYWLRFTGGEWGLALQALLMVAAALLLAAVLMSGAMRARLRVLLSKHLVRYRFDYRQEWLRFTAALADEGTAGNTGAAVLRALAQLVESPAGALWLVQGDELVRSTHWNFDRLNGRETLSGAFVQAQTQRPWIIDLNHEREISTPGAVVPPWLLAERNAWLVLPLMVAGQCIGFVVLAQPRTAVPLNWEVLDLLRAAASQAAGYLALRQTSEQLMEARKFEAFNRMSAFVVHDLKNIVAQLSLMMRNAERHGDNPEFRRDMLETVDNALDKMRQLMTQLREGERPTGLASGVALQELARKLQAQAAQRGRQLDLVLREPLFTRGHADRVERVIGHAVQNAFDASQDAQPVRLQLERFGSYAKLSVQDEGSGMSEEFIRERLFRPFQSTKQQGMGIGLYESRQYVQELGGKLEVQSQTGKGSTVTFMLPLFHVHTEPNVPSPSAT